MMALDPFPDTMGFGGGGGSGTSRVKKEQDLV